MAEAPTGDDTLQPDDAVNILEELLDARNQSYMLGLKLNLPVHEVEAICNKYSDPRERLLHIILAFLRRAEPRPTWSVIVGALRSPIVNLTALAMRVEAAHDLTATRDVVPENTAPAVISDEVKPKAAASPAQSSTTNSSQPTRGTVKRLMQMIENDQQVTKVLMRKEEEQQQQMRQRETELVQAKDKVQEQLRQKDEQLALQGEQLALKDKELADYKKALLQRDPQPQGTQTQPGLLATTSPHSTPAKPRKPTVQCRQKKRAPRDMARGSAATDGRFVYIAPEGSTSPYQYECSTEEWTELPSCPYKNSGLAIIDSELTTVGGWDGAGHTNKLFTLRQGKWVEEYPPMNTACSHPAVVSTFDGDNLIAIGGFVGDWTATVELFQVQSRECYKLTDLPQPLPCPSATICGDTLHVIGIDGYGYSCSLPSHYRQPLTLSWKPLPPLPVKESTAATLRGQLVLIGGKQGGSPVNSIRQLVEGQWVEGQWVKGQWVEIGSMTSGRWQCLAVTPYRILIVGGEGAEDSVEECVVAEPVG